MEFLRRITRATESGDTNEQPTFQEQGEGISILTVGKHRVLCVKHNNSGIFECIKKDAREASVIMEAQKLYAELQKNADRVDALPPSVYSLINTLREKYLDYNATQQLQK